MDEEQLIREKEDFDPPVLNEETMRRWIVKEGEEHDYVDIRKVKVKSYALPDLPLKEVEIEPEEAFYSTVVESPLLDSLYNPLSEDKDIESLRKPKKNYLLIALIGWTVLSSIIFLALFIQKYLM